MKSQRCGTHTDTGNASREESGPKILPSAPPLTPALATALQRLGTAIGVDAGTLADELAIRTG
jgi:hypothetical protein